MSRSSVARRSVGRGRPDRGHPQRRQHLPLPRLIPTLSATRMVGQQPTSTARMLGSQPAGRGGGGSTTVVNQHFVTLKSDELVDLLGQAERGAGAAVYVDGLMPAFAGMMG